MKALLGVRVEYDKTNIHLYFGIKGHKRPYMYIVKMFYLPYHNRCQTYELQLKCMVIGKKSADNIISGNLKPVNGALINYD